MPRWRFYFIGRKKGAIGIRSAITAERDGKSLTEAALALYDEYEHISLSSKTQLLPDECNCDTCGDLVNRAELVVDTEGAGYCKKCWAEPGNRAGVTLRKE